MLRPYLKNWKWRWFPHRASVVCGLTSTVLVFHKQFLNKVFSSESLCICCCLVNRNGNIFCDSIRENRNVCHSFQQRTRIWFVNLKFCLLYNTESPLWSLIWSWFQIYWEFGTFETADSVDLTIYFHFIPKGFWT